MGDTSIEPVAFHQLGQPVRLLDELVEGIRISELIDADQQRVRAVLVEIEPRIGLQIEPDRLFLVVGRAVAAAAAEAPVAERSCTHRGQR